MDDFVYYVVMVLAGGIGGAKGVVGDEDIATLDTPTL
jgi:hypothetical protein